MTNSPLPASEQAAELVYGAMKAAADQSCTDNHPEWVPGGNSLMQDEARRVAASVARLTADQQQATTEREVGLREALERLVSALDRVHADGRYEAVWTIAQLHGAPYTGPTYSAELEAARAALTGSAAK